MSRGVQPQIFASVALLSLSFGLSACAGIVPMEAAPEANDPACADVIVRLPDTVAELGKRETNAQSTGAWGEPASVLLRCGIEPSGPTPLPCVNVNGIDWIRDDSAAPIYRFEAYGRQPGLEVIVNAESDPPVSGTSALIDLGTAVSVLPQTRECLSLSDSYDFE